MNVVRHMFYGSFGTQNLMVTFIFLKFDLRKGQSQFKLGQIRSKFQDQNFHSETCLSYPVLPKDSKNVIYFDVRQIKMQKKSLFKKVTSSLYLFYYCTVKNKCIASKFGMCVFLYVGLQHIFRFFNNSKTFDFIHICL